MALRPIEFYRDLFNAHGDTVYIPTFNGRVIATRDPALVKMIFAQKPQMYRAFAQDALVPLVGRRSLLTIDGEAHKKDRKLIMPSFHGARMKAYGEIIQSAALDAIQQWPVGDTRPIQEVAASVSLQVILRAVFGVEHEEATIAQWRHAITNTFNNIKPAFLFVRALQQPFFGLSPWDKFQRAFDHLKSMIHEEIQKRRGHTEGREDILSMLMDAQYDDDTTMSDDTLCDQLLTLLVAGHETTATSLSWAMYFLHQHPEVLAAIKNEQAQHAHAEGGDPVAISRRPYLKAVIQETLRMRPIVADVLRDLAQPLTLGDYQLEAGMSVAVSVCGVHEREDIYDTPHQFNPDHFVNTSYKPWEYMPFGGGNRRCVGAAFASFEMAIVLDTWLKHASFTLNEPREVRIIRNGLTLVPEHGVRMTLQQR